MHYFYCVVAGNVGCEYVSLVVFMVCELVKMSR